MKFILINAEKLNKNCITRKHDIDNVHQIEELIINREKLTKFLKPNKNIILNLKANLFDLGLKKSLSKILKEEKTNDGKWLYILSNKVIEDAEVCKKITRILNEFGGKKYTPHSEMNINLIKYITDYITKNKLQEHEMKVLFAYKDEKNVNTDIIENCIKRYRKVNIYLKDKPTQLLQDKINKINKNNGTSVEVLKYSKKVFLEYNIVYFVDDLRTNYPRIRLDKTSLVIDEQDAKLDKYNSNVVFMNSLKVGTKKLETLINEYGLLEVAAVVRKMVN